MGQLSRALVRWVRAMNLHHESAESQKEATLRELQEAHNELIAAEPEDPRDHLAQEILSAFDRARE